MGIIRWMWQQAKKDEERAIQAVLNAKMIAQEQEVRTTCKKCKKIFVEGYPYQRTLFGSVKNYVCIDCARDLYLIK